MSDSHQTEGLTAQEIVRRLNSQGSKISSKEADAVKQFVQSSGGVDNARETLELLRQLRDAA